MKIISKYHDYYDGVGAHDREPTPVYLRHSKDIKDVKIERDYLKIGRIDFRPNNSTFKHDRVAYIRIVGFCGKMYPFLHVTKYYGTWGNDDDEKDEEFIYDHDRLDALEYKHYLRWLGEKPGLFYKRDDYIKNLNSSEELKSLFKKYNTPVFLLTKVWNEPYLTINPILKDFHFAKAIDPYTAYQELSMYLGNELTQEHQGNVPTGDDKTLASSKGYDRFSFRKDKGEKTRKGKKKKRG
jgi:hypothetical protein